MEEKNENLQSKKNSILLGGGEKRIEQQHKKGKLTARERLDLLFDSGTFQEYNMHRGTDGEEYTSVVTGIGLVDGRKLCAYSQDFTIKGGTVDDKTAEKICNIQELAYKLKIPVIALLDSGGARIQSGVKALAGYGKLFKNNVRSSGVIPQISAIMGPCAGGAAYSPALTDFVFMVEDTSYMFITGPKVVKSIMMEQISEDKLGGVGVHMQDSGVAHFRCKDDADCIKQIKNLLKYLPDNYCQLVPLRRFRYNSQINVNSLVPDNKRSVYNMKRLIEAIVDEDSLLEVQEEFARNILTFFATVHGMTIGIVANQPFFLAGSLDINASDKASRFINFCSSFNIPVITFIDVPGYLPGKEQESSGIIRHGAKMLYAYSKSCSPKMNVIIRKAYGGAYLGMCSKDIGADYVVAWPDAEVAVMGAEGIVDILYARELQNIPEGEREQFKKEKILEYKEQQMNVTNAARLGYVDEVIDPNETRDKIFLFLKYSYDRDISNKKSEGNFPV